MPSRLPPVYTRTIEVGQDFLPAPATRFVVTQYLETSQDPPYWALIIVGAFFDSEDRIVWSSEVFVAHLDIQLESDDDDDSSESSSEEAASAAGHFARSPSPSFLLRPGRGTIRGIGGENTLLSSDEAASATPELSRTPDLEACGQPRSVHQSAESLPASFFWPAETQPTPAFQPAPVQYIDPPTTWDPTRQGPVPGHWQASYDHVANRWVHTWQPFPF